MLHRALEKIVDKHPDKIAIVGMYRVYTFGELLSQVRSIALYLQD